VTPREPKKQRKIPVPPLTLPSSTKSTHLKEFLEGLSNCSLIRNDKEQIKIIDSEESCELVTPGTVKRIGVIRSSSGKKPQAA
jgi:hypothetical protein